MNRKYNQAKTRYAHTWGRRPVEWIKTTIAEPFPVFYSHVSQKEVRAGKAEGPHYTAGSELFHLYCPKQWEHAQRSAEGLRKDGYTVTVEKVIRPTFCYA